ncbi:MAG: hypothetical protein IKB93_01945, partial [Clostridia bacterium]|nr:hypothetical protein [Clostridia bacterium]
GGDLCVAEAPTEPAGETVRVSGGDLCVAEAPTEPAGENEPFCPCQKSTGFDLSIFYPLRKQWYIITLLRVSNHRRCISSAVAAFSFHNDDIQRQAVDDMQKFVLMIYTPLA